LQVVESDVVETLQLLTLRYVHMNGATSAAAGPAPEPLVHHAEELGGHPPLNELFGQAGPAAAARMRHIRACLEEGGACEACSAVVRVICATPCACLLCVGCASLDRERCPRCDTAYHMQVLGVLAQACAPGSWKHMLLIGVCAAA
jgi:hypothetical protein